MQPVAIAEWTALPLVLSSWHVTQVEESAFGSKGTGCWSAHTGATQVKRRRRVPSALSTQLLLALDFIFIDGSVTAFSCHLYCTQFALLVSDNRESS
jgi:hypothetical protein